MVGIGVQGGAGFLKVPAASLYPDPPQGGCIPGSTLLFGENVPVECGMTAGLKL